MQMQTAGRYGESTRAEYEYHARREIHHEQVGDIDQFYARIPRTKYREQVQRVNSQRLIRWYVILSDLARDIRAVRNTMIHAGMERELRNLSLDVRAFMLDISETLEGSKRRGYVWYDDQWMTRDEMQEQERVRNLSDFERRWEERCRRFDERRDETWQPSRR
jgi:hypothetical protein